MNSVRVGGSAAAGVADMSPTDARTAMKEASRGERRGVHPEIIVLNQLLTSTTPTMTFLMG